MKDIKNILIIILICVAGFFIYRNNSNVINVNKLNFDITILEKKNDSLNLVSNKLEQSYLILQQNIIQDSIKMYKINIELNEAHIIADVSEKKANNYIDKLTLTNKKIKYLENYKGYKNGDSLLLSLSKKIN